jgi:hypothetical protein
VEEEAAEGGGREDSRGSAGGSGDEGGGGRGSGFPPYVVHEGGCEGGVSADGVVDVLDSVVHEGEGAEALGEEPG